ncbi:hypothetical protein G6F56_013985 [Rhizopus delemar]|nr:hypothetical protein G6F56_013985 [Rhizopus delemar]
MDHSSNSAEPLTGDAERDIVIQEPMIDHQVVSNAMNAEEDPILNYKSFFKFDDFSDQVHVYDQKIVNGYTFTTAEQYSIQLNNILQSHKVFRECHRELVRLMNSLIRDGHCSAVRQGN